MSVATTREALALTAETVIGLGVDADPDCSLCGRESRVCPVHYGRAIADALLAAGAVVDVDTLFADLRAQVRSNSPTAPLVTAARDGIERRLRWASVHWGTERVHPDAWPHIAAAACEGVEQHVRGALSERAS